MPSDPTSDSPAQTAVRSSDSGGSSCPDPVLTIGLPVFNAGATIHASLNSITGQTWQGTREILIVDDGSDRENRRILDKLAEEEPTVRLLRHSENRGRPYARNTILENARGRFMTWIDADDEWYPVKLQRQFEQLYATNGDESRSICLSSYDWQWEGSTRIRRKSPVLEGNPLAGVLNGSIGCYLWTMLATTATFRSIGMFDTNLPRLQDLEFLIRYAALGGQFTATSPEEPLCIYRKSDIGRAGSEVEASVRHIWKKHHLAFSSFGSRFERYAKQDHLLLCARHYQNNGQRMRAVPAILEAVMMAPKRGIKSFAK